jgi:biopolymer transport protein ExbB
MNSRTFFAVAVTLVSTATLISSAGGQAPVEPGSVPNPVTAQQAPDQQALPSGEASAGDGAKSLGGMIISGGILNVVFFGILGIFSLWAATVVLERVFNLRRDKLLPDAFAKQLAQIVETPQANVSRFRTLCEENSAPASRILQAGVARAGRPVPEVEKAMEDAAAREMALLRAKSRPLNVVGSIAPLVGLLGTVVGMIMAFQISSQEGLGKAELLAEGIYLALMTTAAGLTIAIPCLLFASWFHARSERYMCDISESMATTMASFAKMENKPVNNTSVELADQDLSPRERFLREGVT